MPQLKTMMLSPLSVYWAPSPQTYTGKWSPVLMSPIGDLQAFICFQYFDMASLLISGNIPRCIIQGNSSLGRSSGIRLQSRSWTKNILTCMNGLPHQQLAFRGQPSFHRHHILQGEFVRRKLVPRLQKFSCLISWSLASTNTSSYKAKMHQCPVVVSAVSVTCHAWCSGGVCLISQIKRVSHSGHIKSPFHETWAPATD